ncbi:MAG TPA: hypothetical protein VJQ56_00475 [Blastocatellia bacterium]|nr:hypothetical protein [Blastocatellia bacterium]
MAEAKEDEKPSEEDMCEAEIDYNLMETFPASDPPSWTLGISPRKKEHHSFNQELPSADDPSHQNEAARPTSEQENDG